MNLLLDTQALLWWREGSHKLGPRARRAIDQGGSSVLVSAATGWEIAIKASTGRLRLPQPTEAWMASVLDGSGVAVLAVTMAHALAVGGLPLHHADPFDRLLIAQAQLEHLTVVTSDAAFDDYDVKVLDARA